MNYLIQLLLLFLFVGLPVANAYWKPKPGLTWNYDLIENPNSLSM